MMQSDMDYLVVIKTMESQISDWHQATTSSTSILYAAEWHQTRAADMNERYEYYVVVERFYYNYAMLVVNSFGLQNAMDRATINLGYFFTRCHTHATACAMMVRDELGPRGYMRYSPDSHFVLSSYAVLSLLKVSSALTSSIIILTLLLARSAGVPRLPRPRVRNAQPRWGRR
jgi:hypothetical protein